MAPYDKMFRLRIDYINQHEFPKTLVQEIEVIKRNQNRIDKLWQEDPIQARQNLLCLQKQYTQHPFDTYKVENITGCHCSTRDLYEKILDVETPSQGEVIAYNSCKHTIYAAAKRQMKAAPTPHPEVALDFIKHTIDIIEREVGEQLNNFGYSYQQWYAHLTRAKQIDMDIVAAYYTHQEKLTKAQIQMVQDEVYEGICKVEIQEPNGKPRMVCSIPKKFKFAMGPVTWKLEEIFAEYFKGYCGGKNLDEMADMINKYADLGFTKVVEGDGSAFDNTQDVTLKEIDRYLYRRILHSIHHIPKQEFIKISQKLYKTMVLKYRKEKKIKTLFQYSVLGTVFSGDCDTTLANTIRMAAYNRYVNDKAGWKYGVDYVAFSKGDDFTVMYKPYIDDESIHQAYAQYFLPSNPNPEESDSRVYGLGQVLKMLDIGQLNSIKFCSLRAWYKDNEGHIVLTRDPAKFYKLGKYARKSKTLSNVAFIAYLEQQAIALEASYKGIKLFDTMALAYRHRAQQIRQVTKLDSAKEQVIRKLIEVYSLHQLNAEDSRQGESPFMPEEDEKYRYWYDVKYKKIYFKIIEDYWTTQQLIERRRVQKLTQQELQLINEQIEAEFSTEELKTLMGLKNEQQN